MGRSAWLRLWPLWAIPTVLIAVNAVWLFALRGTVLGRGSMLARERTALESDVASLTRQRDALAGAQGSLNDLHHDLGALRQEQLGSMRERLVSFLVDVARRTQAAGLHPERISYAAQPDRKSGLVHFGATFNVTGTYEQIRRCVNLLEGSPQFVLVERLALRSDETAASLDIAVQLAVATFFADVDTGMLRQLGIEDVPEVAAAHAGAASATGTPTPTAPPRTDFSSVDARVMEDLRSAVANLSNGEASGEEDVFVAPQPDETRSRPRSGRPRPLPGQGGDAAAFMGQMGAREVSGGR